MIGCFLAISNPREDTNRASDFVFCSAVNIWVSKPECEHDSGSVELEGNSCVTQVPCSLLGKDVTLNHLRAPSP